MSGKYHGIILVGKPGSGKSTIGRTIAKQTGMIYVSSGDIARKLAETDIVTADNLSHGKMADEDSMRLAIHSELSEIVTCGNRFILDGFPRFTDQLQWLNNRFKFYTYFVILPTTECINRMVERQRVDDINDIILNRIDFYTKHTEPMIEQIRKSMIYECIDGSIDNDKLTHIIRGWHKI